MKTDRENLFAEFVRIKNEKTRNITGSGLGLSIVKKVVELYNGTISVDSVPDVGSTFTVRLPKKPVNYLIIYDFITRKNSRKAE